MSYDTIRIERKRNCMDVERSAMEERENRMRTIMQDYECRKNGVNLYDLEKALREFGIQVSEIRRNSLDDFAEITAYLNPAKFNSTFKTTGITITDLRPKPKKVIFSGPATTILWMDGTKTTVKCSDEDVWEDEVGIAMCYLKKLLGNKGNYNNIFREAMKVAEVQYKKEDLVYGEVESISDVIDQAEDIGSYMSSAFSDMSKNIETVRKCMQDAANKLSEVGKEKK